jgi:hypothetical protein
MYISKKMLLAAALGTALLVVTYKYAYMEGSIGTADALNEIGHLQIYRTEAALNVIDAIEQKTILPTAGNAAASVVNGIFFDFVLIDKTLGRKQRQAVCSKVNDPKVISVLKSDRLYGDAKTSWDQAGVKGIVELCEGLKQG